MACFFYKPGFGLSGLLMDCPEELQTRSARLSRTLAQVRELLHKRIRDTFLHPQFNTDVMKPLNIEALIDQEVTYPFHRLLRPCCCDLPRRLPAGRNLGC